MGIVASRRPYWTSAFVLWLEAPCNFALQASCHRPDHQRRSPESGTHVSRVSFVILETQVLDLEREICSAPSAEQMLWLSEKEGEPAGQFTAERPKDRATPSEPPLTRVGIDCFGPIEMKSGRSSVQRYGCLFTCLTMRTAHIEFLHSVSADSMINALKRFISMQGCPKEISWQGVERCYSTVEPQKDQQFLPTEGNQVDIARCKPHGWLVGENGSNCQTSLLKEHVVADEVLSTVMAEVDYQQSSLNAQQWQCPRRWANFV